MIICELSEKFKNKFFQYCYIKNLRVDCGGCPLDRHLCNYVLNLVYFRVPKYKSNIYARIVISMTAYK